MANIEGVFAMGAPVERREDDSSDDLRALARRVKDANQSRRLLAWLRLRRIGGVGDRLAEREGFQAAVALRDSGQAIPDDVE